MEEVKGDFFYYILSKHEPKLITSPVYDKLSIYEKLNNGFDFNSSINLSPKVFNCILGFNCCDIKISYWGTHILTLTRNCYLFEYKDESYLITDIWHLLILYFLVTGEKLSFNRDKFNKNEFSKEVIEDHLIYELKNPNLKGYERDVIYRKIAKLKQEWNAKN